ncbi:putative T7SS-secreted protein, partial [Klebsiella pneumoniae]|uniref:putative T7SS-secreted protein n=1 Tax=Klebsiella pneumoniae TaxID=573 RepID=UPI003EE09A3A
HALVPGDPERVSSLADQLSTIAAGLSAGAELVAAVGVGLWQGPAAAAFLGALGLAPGPLRAGGDAFGAAASVVRAHATVLAEAQS